MFGNQRLSLARGPLQRRQGSIVADIPESNTDVAKQPATPGAQYRRARETELEALFVERQQLQQVRGTKVRSRVRFHYLSFARESVPGTHGQAIVTPKNPISNRRAEFHRNWSFELDGEAGDTPPGIELKRRFNGPSRAGRDTPHARTAAVSRRGIWFQLKAGDNLRKKNPVAESAADEIRVFSDESQSGTLGQVAFEHRTGIHIPQGTGALAAQFVDKQGKRLKPFAKHFMIIAAPRVAGDKAEKPPGTATTGR
jgi:hypothetical protein